MKNIYILFTLFCNLTNLNYDCTLNLDELNIRNFELGMSFKVLKNKQFSFYKEISLTKKIKIVEFSESINLLGEKQITYELTFDNNKLVHYQFKLIIGKNKDGMLFFNDILKLIDKSKNKFIKGDDIAFMEVNSKCKKFFRLQDFEDSSCLYGGIGTLSR